MTIHNPYEDAFALSWFKGDLHIHSDASDGRASLAQIRERLRECEFDFAALADHDRFCPPDENGLPVLIGNSEMRSAEGGDVLTLFAEVPCVPGQSVQDIIDRTRNAGGLPVFAHPRIGEFETRKYHWSYPSNKLIDAYHDYLGMEVYTHNIGSGFQTAIDRLDALWIARCRASPQPVGIWGFATSDAHDLNRIKPNVGILVAVENVSEAALRHAIEHGRFYSLADSKARFTEIRVKDGVLRVAARNARMLRLYGCPRQEGAGERRLLGITWAVDQNNVAITYKLKGTEGFVRAEAADRDGNFIYANPLRIVA